MNGKAIMTLCRPVVALLFALASCQSGVLDTEDGTRMAGDGEVVTRNVTISMSPQSSASEVYGENWTTKTALHLYDTAGISKIGVEGKWHPVEWKVGDEIYCYCQTGVYMSYRLTEEDILATGSFIGAEAKCQVIYRVGDTWVACYCKGPKIGNHIGYRQKDDLVLSNGIPREQTGVFDDYHICFAENHPDDPFEFQNMQAFVRFEVSQASGSAVADGKLLGFPVTKIEVRSMTAREKMAGNLEILEDGGWRTSLLDRGEAADSMITVTPSGGTFVKNTHYFVAVPARRYSDGLRFDLFTKATGESAATRKAYVEVPGTTIQCFQIFNIHDLLKYCALLVTEINFDYGPDHKVETTGIEIVKGYTGKLVPVFTPTSATDKSVKWETDDPSVATVDQNGNVTGMSLGTCFITVTSKDGGNASQKVKVTVKEEGGDGFDGYTPSTFPWS